MAERRAAGAILYFRDQGKTYFLTVQRANTKKWQGSVMMGPAETMDDHDKGKIWKTIWRGLREELGLFRQDVLSIKPYGHLSEGEVRAHYEQVRQKGARPRFTDPHQYDADFFFVEIRPRTMARLVREIKDGRHYELRGPRLVRRLSAVVPKVAQPHYGVLLKRLQSEITPISDPARRPRKRPPRRA